MNTAFNMIQVYTNKPIKYTRDKQDTMEEDDNMKEHYTNYTNGTYIIPKEGTKKQGKNMQQTQLLMLSKSTPTNQ